MIRKIFLFLLLATYLQAAPQPAYPNPFIENSINVTTGDCIIIEQDLEVRGAQPIYLNREYVNGSRREEDGGWNFIPHLTLLYCKDEDDTRAWIYITQPDGQQLLFRTPHKVKEDITELKFANYISGIRNQRTLQHLKSIKAFIRHDYKYIYVNNYDGTRRCYKRGTSADKINEKTYFLQWEELPNGNYYEYYFNEKGQLGRIESKNPTKTKTYAWCDFVYKDSPFGNYFIAETSNLTKCTYYYDYLKHTKFHKYFLFDIRRAEKPVETILYTNKHRENQCSSIAERRLGDSKLRYFYYRENSPEIINSKDRRIHRIKKIVAPVGSNGAEIPIYTFDYNLHRDGSGITTVVDSEKNHTNYHYNSLKQITRIEKKNSSERFIWGTEELKNLLLAYIHYENTTPIFAQTYEYDERGNLTRETTWGNITKSQIPLAVNAKGLPIDNGIDKTSKTYTYSQDGRNLLFSETNQNGVETRYTYLPNTNLIRTVEIVGKDKTTFEYNQDNILTKKTTHSGKQQTTYTLYPDNRIKKITDPITTTEFTYAQNGKVATKTIYDSEGQEQYTLNYIYDEMANLVSETNPIGQTAIATYDKNCKPTSATAFDGTLQYSFTYDRQGRLGAKTKTSPDNSTQTEKYTYNQHNKHTSHTDHRGNTNHFTYDSNSNCTSIQKGSIVTKKTYNTLGHTLTEIDGEGNTITYTRNILGSPLSITHPDGATEYFSYNLDNTLSKSISPSGTITRYTYDKHKRLLSKSIYTPEDQLLTTQAHEYDEHHLIRSTDPLGITTKYTYDDLGRKTAETTGPLTTTFLYDPLGRLYQSQTENQITQYTYDLLDREIAKLSLDSQDNLFAKTETEHDAFGNKKAIHTYIEGRKATQIFTYDPFGRLTEEIDPEGNKTTYTYKDAPLSIKITTLSNGNRIKETFDESDRLISSHTYAVNDDLLHATTYEYNHTNQCTKQIDTITDGDNSWEQITLREYNSRNQLTRLIEAPQTKECKITTFAYDTSGRLICTQNPNKTTIEYSYTPLDKLHTLTTKDVSYLYHYDLSGRITQVDDLINNTTTKRSYDCLGNLTSETLDSNFAIHNQYDNLGRRTKCILPDHSTIEYIYDAYHLKQILRNDHLIHEYFSYDLSGNLLQDSLGTYHYNLLGQKEGISSPYHTQAVTEKDSLGNPLLETINNTDHLYTYNSLSQITSDPYHHYTYDSLHNRTSKDQNSYTLNNTNQLLFTSSAQYQYDANGYPISKKTKDGTIHYTYDGLGRLTLAETNIWRITFAYDSFHRRISKTIHTQPDNTWKRTHKEYYLYDGDNEIGSANHQLRILGHTNHAEMGSAVRIELNNHSYKPIYDIQGSLCGLATDHQIEKTKYTPFGETLIPSTHNNPWGYLSKRHEPELGLIFFGRRYYEPETGRFFTPDPAGFTDSINLYAYCNSNPLTTRDLYGLNIHIEVQVDIQDAWRIGLQGMSYTGEGVYNFAYHAVPIPLVRQALMAFGNLLKRAKSPYESPPSTDNSLAGHIPNNSFTLVVNGILTERELARYNAQHLCSSLQGMHLHYYHSTTRGFIPDILNTVWALMGFQTQDSIDIARILHARAEFYKANNIDGHIFALAHSRGGAYLANALKFLSPEEKAMTHVYTFGSASLFNTPGLASLTHYVSTRDPVSMLGSPLAYTQAKMGKRDNVQFLPPKGGSFFDHSFLGETYADQLDRVSARILDILEQ